MEDSSVKSASHLKEYKGSTQQPAYLCSWHLHKTWPTFPEQKIKKDDLASTLSVTRFLYPAARLSCRPEFQFCLETAIWKES